MLLYEKQFRVHLLVSSPIDIKRHEKDRSNIYKSLEEMKHATFYLVRNTTWVFMVKLAGD